MEHRDNIVVLNQQKFANSPVKYFTASFLLGDRFRNLEGEQIGEIKAIRLNFSEGPMGSYRDPIQWTSNFGRKIFVLPVWLPSLIPSKKVSSLIEGKRPLEKLPGLNKDQSSIPMVAKNRSFSNGH